MPQVGEDEHTLWILTRKQYLRISSMGHSWLSEYTFPKVHTHLCYKIKCQNFSVSILLDKAMSESLGHRNLFHQNR